MSQKRREVFGESEVAWGTAGSSSGMDAVCSASAAYDFDRPGGHSAARRRGRVPNGKSSGEENRLGGRSNGRMTVNVLC